jgi:iron complex outermembrane recepter protein
LQLRLGAAETMTRPELNQLAPTRTDNSLNRVYQINYSGNADLKPIKAYQGDISLEWYYQPKSALTLALFGKKLVDFITTGTTYNVDVGAQGYFNGSTTAVPVLYTVQQPINGDRGYVSGIELGWQHIFDNGFGLRGQYTRNNSKAWVQGQYVGQLEGVAASAASAGVIYEAHNIAASVSWDYTGSFVAETFTEVPGWSAISDSFSWVTASLSYELTRGFKIYVEGKNLANAIQRTFLQGRRDAIWSYGAPIAGTGSSVDQGYSASGRTYTAGVSYRF